MSEPSSHISTPPRRVALFGTCLGLSLLPGVGRAVERLLVGLGVEVYSPPDQVCCGQSLLKAGHPRQAARVGEAWVRAFRDAPLIVSPSGSCVAHVRHHLVGLLPPALAPLAREVAGRTYELSEFLTRALDAPAELKRRGAAAPVEPDEPWAYPPSCGLHRALGEDEAPYRLLEALAGPPRLDIEEPERCCGFGGPFSVSHPELSAAMLTQKLDSAAQAGARTLVVGDLGCLLHLSCGARQRGQALRVVHLAELLAEALERAGRREARP
jgi:L-lactate dehydrogenase complex protein LldE